jgi:hypothetical protein
MDEHGDDPGAKKYHACDPRDMPEAGNDPYEYRRMGYGVSYVDGHRRSTTATKRLLAVEHDERRKERDRHGERDHRNLGGRVERSRREEGLNDVHRDKD